MRNRLSVRSYLEIFSSGLKFCPIWCFRILFLFALLSSYLISTTLYAASSAEIDASALEISSQKDARCNALLDLKRIILDGHAGLIEPQNVGPKQVVALLYSIGSKMYLAEWSKLLDETLRSDLEIPVRDRGVTLVQFAGEQLKLTSDAPVLSLKAFYRLLLLRLESEKAVQAEFIVFHDRYIGYDEKLVASKSDIYLSKFRKLYPQQFAQNGRTIGYDKPDFTYHRNFSKLLMSGIFGTAFGLAAGLARVIPPHHFQSQDWSGVGTTAGVGVVIGLMASYSRDDYYREKFAESNSELNKLRKVIVPEPLSPRLSPDTLGIPAKQIIAWIQILESVRLRILTGVSALFTSDLNLRSLRSKIKSGVESGDPVNAFYSVRLDLQKLDARFSADSLQKSLASLKVIKSDLTREKEDLTKSLREYMPGSLSAEEAKSYFDLSANFLDVLKQYINVTDQLIQALSGDDAHLQSFIQAWNDSFGDLLGLLEITIEENPSTHSILASLRDIDFLLQIMEGAKE